MTNVTTEKLSINQLFKKFEEREFAIPQIQRKFVWKKFQVTELMDSIYRGIPIGVFMIWRTKGSKTIELKPNSNSIIRPFNTNNKTADIIIDGQQRLSTMCGIMYGVTPDIDKNAKIDFSKIYFDTASGVGKKFFYRGSLLGSTNEAIQLSELISDSAAVIARRYQLNRKQKLEVQTCKTRFLNYRFYSLVIETNNVEEVQETFIRINSKGMTVSRADILFAQTSQVGLRDRVMETKREMAFGYHGLKDKVFNSAIALMEGEKEIGTKAIDSFVKKLNTQGFTKTEYKNKWKRYHNAFLHAQDFLINDMQVPSLNFLPSENMFAMLSLFFFHNGKRVSALQKSDLKKWFWHTALGERYSGGNFSKNIPADTKFMHNLALKKRSCYTIDKKIESIDLLRKKYSNPNSAAVKAFFLLLKSNNPRYLETGESMYMGTTSAFANRRDRHHIFPSTLFSTRKISSNWTNSIANICYLASNENESVGGSFPSHYLKRYNNYKWFSSVIKSHILPTNADSGLWGNRLKEDFVRFINCRGKLVLARFSKEAGLEERHLFTKFEGITRI